jgi:hypothetical protein
LRLEPRLDLLQTSLEDSWIGDVDVVELLFLSPLGRNLMVSMECTYVGKFSVKFENQ